MRTSSFLGLLLLLGFTLAASGASTLLPKAIAALGGQTALQSLSAVTYNYNSYQKFSVAEGTPLQTSLSSEALELIPQRNQDSSREHRMWPLTRTGRRRYRSSSTGL